MNYKKTDITSLSINPADFFEKDWAVLSAGDANNHNSMIVSWGMIGTLWAKTVVAAFVRPQRYTFEFMENNDFFTLSFYDESMHGKIAPFGSKSGRDCDKYGITGINAVTCGNTVFTENAKLILVCKKLSKADMKPEHFIDDSIDGKWYPKNDYHRVYIGEIVECYVQDN